MNNNNSDKSNAPRNVSGKLRIIDQCTYEQLRLEPKTSYKVKNVKYKKSQQVFSLQHFIKSKCKRKKVVKTHSIYKTGKTFISKRKRQYSKLKKSILKYRLMKKSETEAANKKLDLCTKPEPEDVTEFFKNLSIGNPSTSEVHSRRFRNYCNNTTSQDLCNLLETLLRELNRFQKRAFQSNEFKGRSRRRLVFGFREVQVQMKISKIKLVLIATDCEVCDIKGGLDETVMSIREDCQNRSIPCAFAFQRRKLSYVLFKKSPISCVGIIDYDGAQEIFFKVLTALEFEKCNYRRLFQKN